MARTKEKKLFVGTRLRRLRRGLGLTQAQMAEGLDISPSYFNLLERNQRPLSAPLLLRLTNVFGIDIKEFNIDEVSRTIAGLNEVLADRLFEGLQVTGGELTDMVGASPSTASAMLTLYRAYRESITNIAALTEMVERGEASETFGSHRYPIEEVRDYFQDNDNHFPALEKATETLWQDAGFDQEDLYHSLSRHLEKTHGITVRTVADGELVDCIWRLDPHSRRLLISPSVDRSSRIFTMAHQLALLGYRDLIDATMGQSSLRDEDTQQLCRLGLANYFAAAAMMPYSAFLRAAEESRYDLNHLCRRFGTSYEQTCHRLTTLQRTGARGVPLFFLRIDHAGNVLKRFSADGFHFARFGTVCPRWDIHRAFESPGDIRTQIVESESGDVYFTFFRTSGSTLGGCHPAEQRRAIGMGCRIEHAHKLVYSNGMNLTDTSHATPIGPNCRLCERANCAHRAYPAPNRQVAIGEHEHGVSPYSFETW